MVKNVRNLLSVEQIHQAVAMYLQMISEKCNAPFKNCEITLPLRDFSQYFDLVRQYNIATPDVIVTALVYLARLKGNGDLVCTHDNVQGVFTAALLISNKFHEDIPFDNKTFSRLADIYLHELNSLELNICLALKFNTTVTRDELEHVYATLYMVHQQYCQSDASIQVNPSSTVSTISSS